MAKISVIVPVYNVEEYLSNCIDSILQQTFKDFDLILVDDGSTDNSGTICDNYSKKDNRIIIIHKNNAGVSSARNVGLDWAFNNSDSEWIAFIDADDWIDLNYLDILYSFRKNVDIVSCDFQIVYEHFTDFSTTTSSGVVVYRGKAIFKNTNNRPCWARIYKKTAIMNCVFNEKIPLGEDVLFNIDVIANNNNLIMNVCKKKLYYYYQRSDSLTHRNKNEKFLPMIQEMVKKGNKNKKNSGLYYLIASKWYLSLRYTFSLYANKTLYRKCNKELLKIMPILIKSNCNFTEKAKIFLSFLVPQVYRKYRIKKDKNMLTWEKTIKEANGID